MERRNVSREAPAPAPGAPAPVPAPATKKPFMLKRTRFSGPFPPPSRPPAAKPSAESETRHSATPAPTAQPTVPSPVSTASSDPEIMQPAESINVVEKKGSKRLSNIPPPEIQQAFDSALNSETYRVWKDEHGLTGTKGAMLPPGYKKFDHPEFPWICPIRSCRELFDKLFGLGKHFNITHRASRLNDNLDGTLSELGKYDSAEKGDGVLHGGYGKPPLLVSKKSISLADDPLVEPNLQRARERVAKSQAQRHINSRRKSHLLPSDDEEDVLIPDSPPPPPPARMSTRSQTTSTPRSTATTPMQGLTASEDDRPYGMFPDEKGQLVGMHGGLLPTGYQLDTTVSGRPWICPIRSCRYLFKARHELGRHFLIRIHRGMGLNDNLDGTFSVVEESRPDVETTPYVVSRGRPNTPEPIGVPKVPTYPHTKTCVWVPVESEGQQGNGIPMNLESIRRHQPRTQSHTSSDDGENGSLPNVGRGKRSRNDGEEHGDSFLDRPTPKRSRFVTMEVAQQGQPQPANSAIVVPGARVIPQSELEMEDWEVGDQPAPALPQAQHAFSALQLSGQVVIPGHQNLAVQVVNIPSGTHHVFPADNGRTRICSLYSGKLRVQFKGEKNQEGAEEFVIGAGGVFMVGAGRECWVMNRCYLDLRLQVMSCEV